MNQKNIFTGISVLLLLQGIGFFFMKDQLMTSTFPAVEGAGHEALTRLLEVMSALSILIGIVAWTARNSPDTVAGFAIGFLVLILVTLKHVLIDTINVPIFAIVIQVLIFLSCAYLWMQGDKEEGED